MSGRVSKAAMCLALGLFAGLVTYDNLVDYGSNYAFVQHVLSMDTTYPGNALTDRAITSPTLWRVTFALIILGEGLTALLFLVAAAALWRVRGTRAVEFEAAKVWVHLAATMGFFVWFIGFLVIGGEWFAMWQSPRWNGQEAAFRFTLVILAVLIFVNQPDRPPTE